MPSTRCLTRLLGAAILLPIATVVLAAFGQLLKALGDASGAAVLMRLILAGGILWVLTLVGLLLMLAVRHVASGCSSANDEEVERDQ